MRAVSPANSVNSFVDPIEEDRPLYYALTCLPLIGPLFNETKESSLSQQIHTNLQHPQRVIALLEVKNKYKVSAIARHVIWIASLITAIACHVLSPAIGALLIGIWIALAVRQIRQIKANRELIQMVHDDTHQGNRICPFTQILLKRN